MGNRIKGITVEINGNTTKLTSALQSANKAISSTQTALKDVEKLLKLDPTNTDLLKQKQEYLAQAISSTKEKLDMEKAALEQLKNADSTAETAEQQNALQREIIDTTNKLEALEKQAASAASVLGTKMQEAGKKVQEVGGKISGIGKSMSTHVTAPIVAIGAASLAAFNEVDEGLDIIVEKTGASGDALADMQERAKRIATQIPTDFQTAGSAIGEVNTRFHLTGDALEQLATKFIKFSSLNKTDVSTSVDTVQKVLAAFNLEADDAGAVLDLLNTQGQRTGISMDKLATSMVSNAASLQQMNMDAANSAEFLGDLETAGVDSTVVLSGLKKALANAAAEGTSMEKALADIEESMVSATDSTDGINAACTLFGTKAGPAIYQACKTGQISFKSLGTSIEKNLENVEKTFDATLDPIDGMKTAMNSLKVAGSDMGAAIQSAAAPMVQSLAEKVESATKKFKALNPEQQETIVKMGAIAAAAGPAAVAVGKITETGGKLMETGGKVVTMFSQWNGSLAGMAGPAGIAVGALALVGTGLGGLIVHIGETLDPVNRLTNDIEDIGRAQETISGADNIIALCDRYEELSAQTKDASLSESDLAAVEAEMEDIRNQLSVATDGAVSAEGEFNAELDATIEKEKIIAESEKERANTDLLAKLVEGAKDYQNALSKQRKLQVELAEAEEHRNNVSQALLDGSKESYDSLRESVTQLADDIENGVITAEEHWTESANGVIHTTNDVEEALNQLEQKVYDVTGKKVNFATIDGAIEYIENLEDSELSLAEASDEAAEHHDELEKKLEEVQSVTDEYKTSVMNLVRSGYLDAQRGADMLGVSVDDLRHYMVVAEQEERNAAAATGELTEAQKEAITAAEQQAAAEKEAAETFAEMVTALEGMPDVLSLTGTSATEMATLLTNANMTVDEFSAGITSMRESTVNNFKLLAEGTELTAAEMVSVLQQNLETQQQWSYNLSQLWKQAYADEDVAVMQYIQKLADMGPEYAGAVAEFANGGYSKLQEAAAAWQGIGEQSTSDLAAGMWMNSYLAEEAAGGIVTSTAEKMQSSTNAQESGAGVAQDYASGVESASPAAEAAGEEVGNAAISGAKSAAGDANSAGADLGQALVDGVSSKQSDAKTAGTKISEKIISGISENNSKMRSTGKDAATAVASGLTSGSGTVVAAASALASAAQSAASISGWYSVGYNMSSGIASGVRAGSYLISNAVRAAAYDALAAAKRTLDIHSPSRVFRDQVGKMIPDGIALGVLDGRGTIMKALDNLESKMTESFHGTALLNASQTVPSQIVNNSYTGIHYSDIALRCLILATTAPQDARYPAQPFRIYEISRPISGVITVYARHLAYDLDGIVVSPVWAYGIAGALYALSNDTVPSCPFTFWTDKTSKTTMRIPVPSTVWSLMGGSEGSILDIYGGEWEFDRFNIKLHDKRGRDRGFHIRYGKKLTDLRQEENCASVYTGVYPYWVGDKTWLILPERTLDVPDIHYNYSRIMPLDLSDQSQADGEDMTVDTLRQLAQSYMTRNSIGVPNVNLEVSFVSLEQAGEYDAMQQFEEVQLCDTAHVEFPKMDISVSAKVIKTVYNSLTDRLQSIDIGSPKSGLIDSIVDRWKSKPVLIGNGCLEGPEPIV